MIRVLQVVTKMGYGGLEAMIMNYYRHIDRNKIQFDFLVHRPEEADYHEEIRSLGGKIFNIQRLVPWSLSYKKELKQFFLSHPEYQIIHVHQDCMSSVILKIAKECGVPYRIAHAHSSSQDKNLKYPIKMHYKKYINKYATKLFACGNDAGNFIFGSAPYDIMTNAIDTSEYTFNSRKRTEVRALLGVGDEEVLIGHVGKFRVQKNQSFLVDVFSEIDKKQETKLLMIGTGDQFSAVQDKVEKLRLSDKVIMTGVRADIADLLQAMDVFVFPSTYEGLPMVLIEAQASGLPCLVSDKVPIECKKTDLVYQFPLDSSARSWADKALELSTIKREDKSAEIKQSGYDITENAVRLQRYYMDLAQGVS